MEMIPNRLRSFSHIREHNWLNHTLIIEFLNGASAKYSAGSLVDIGCGSKPYKPIFEPYVTRHIGIDVSTSSSDVHMVDIVAEAYKTGLKTASCSTILCTEVLEHLEEPLEAIREMYRILKDQGTVILTVPFFWPIHEAPRDFFRYSEHGLRYLFERERFEIVELTPLTGYIATFAQLSIYFLKRFERGHILRNLGRIFNWVAQTVALKLNRYDKSWDFTTLYGLVARKV